MSTLDAPALAKLRAPFTPEAIKWKLQVSPKPRDGGGFSKGVAVSYIDARLVTERLNDVAAGEWSVTYGPFNAGMVVARLTVLGAAREDVGFAAADADDPGKAIKAAYSDAIKRAAVGFGIGAFLYALPKNFLDAGQLVQRGRSWYLQAEAENLLTGNYARWLARKDVIERFGAPIDHGDRVAAAPAEPPRNFSNDEHVAAVQGLVKSRGITVASLRNLLDVAEVTPNDDVRARLAGASIDQLVHVRREIESTPA